MLSPEKFQTAVNDCINTTIKLFCLSGEVEDSQYCLDLKRIMKGEKLSKRNIQQAEHYLKYRGLVVDEIQLEAAVIVFRVCVSNLVYEKRQSELFRSYPGFNPQHATDMAIHQCVDPQIDKAIDLLVASQTETMAVNAEEYLDIPDHGDMIRRKMLIPVIRIPAKLVMVDDMIGAGKHDPYVTRRGLKPLQAKQKDEGSVYHFIADLQEIALTRAQKERAAPLMLPIIRSENIGYIPKERQLENYPI